MPAKQYKTSNCSTLHMPGKDVTLVQHERGLCLTAAWGWRAARATTFLRLAYKSCKLTTRLARLIEMTWLFCNRYSLEKTIGTDTGEPFSSNLQSKIIQHEVKCVNMQKVMVLHNESRWVNCVNQQSLCSSGSQNARSGVNLPLLSFQINWGLFVYPLSLWADQSWFTLHSQLAG